MPFPCNGILLIQGIFPMYTLRQASFRIPFSNYFKMVLLGMAQLYTLTYLGGKAKFIILERKVPTPLNTGKFSVRYSYAQ